MLFYVALGKRRQLAALIGANQHGDRQSEQDQRLAGFLVEDFSTQVNRTKAVKNASVLMQKKRYHMAASFYILAGQLKQVRVASSASFPLYHQLPKLYCNVGPGHLCIAQACRDRACVVLVSS